MARKKKVQPVIHELTEVKNVAELVKNLNVGETIRLRGQRVKLVEQKLNRFKPTYSTWVDRKRTMTIKDATFQWTNVSYAVAAKAGDPSKHNRSITRIS